MAACALPRPHLCDEVFLGALAMPLLCAEDDADAELELHAGVLGGAPLAAFAGPLRAAFPGQPRGAKNTPHTPGPAEDRGVGGEREVDGDMGDSFEVRAPRRVAWAAKGQRIVGLLLNSNCQSCSSKHFSLLRNHEIRHPYLTRSSLRVGFGQAALGLQRCACWSPLPPPALPCGKWAARAKSPAISRAISPGHFFVPGGSRRFRGLTPHRGKWFCTRQRRRGRAMAEAAAEAEVEEEAAAEEEVSEAGLGVDIGGSLGACSAYDARLAAACLEPLGTRERQALGDLGDDGCEELSAFIAECFGEESEGGEVRPCAARSARRRGPGD